MRTWNFTLLVFIVISAISVSTAEAQRSQLPLLSGSSNSRTALANARSNYYSGPSTYYTANSQRYPYVVARPEDRQWLRETPIELRPNRPMHFWGNSRRRTLR